MAACASVGSCWAVPLEEEGGQSLAFVWWCAPETSHLLKWVPGARDAQMTQFKATFSLPKKKLNGEQAATVNLSNIQQFQEEEPWKDVGQSRCACDGGAHHWVLEGSH